MGPEGLRKSGGLQLSALLGWEVHSAGLGAQTNFNVDYRRKMANISGPDRII